MFDQENFITWLRARRHELDLTQDKLARLVGCSRDMIKKIELGTRRPSREFAYLLAEALDVPESDRSAFVLWARRGLHAPNDDS